MSEHHCFTPTSTAQLAATFGHPPREGTPLLCFSVVHSAHVPRLDCLLGLLDIALQAMRKSTDLLASMEPSGVIDSLVADMEGKPEQVACLPHED